MINTVYAKFICIRDVHIKFVYIFNILGIQLWEILCMMVFMTKFMVKYCNVRKYILFIQSIRTIFILQLIISNYLNYSINSNSHRGVSMSMNTDEKERVQEELYDETLLDQYLENDDIDQFRDEFLALHTYEQSEYFEDTTDENRQKIFQYLSPEEVANFFDQLDIDDDEYELLFDKMNATYASHILEEMSYDNAVDILNELTKPKVASLLTLMNKDDANEIKALLHYDEDTAGGIMTTEYLSLKAHTPVKEALLLVKAQAPDAETIYVIFVVDDDGKLVGVLSLRDLIVAENDAYIEDIMNERVISVNVADDQEDVAQVMRDYDFMAVPVIDYQEHLLGIITIDDILDVMDEEASEDYFLV